MGEHKERYMTEQQALDFLKSKGVKVDGNRIERGSYGLKVWSAIDCLINHVGRYNLVEG